jgi:hypothetical protein
MNSRPWIALVAVERAGGAVLVEEAAAGGVDPDARVGPPVVHPEAVDLVTEPADGLADLTEGVPVPLAGLGELAGVGRAGLGDQVEVEVEREGRDVARQAPQRLRPTPGSGS